MQTLFPISPQLPDGFEYYPGFISEEEEDELVKIIRTFPLKNMIFQGFEAKRKVMSFGFDYHFDSRKLTRGKPVPYEFNNIIIKAAAKLNVDSEKIEELLLTGYAPGTVINWHRDAPPFGIIAGISLLSDCVFKLRPYERSKQSRSAIRSIGVERRSLYVMKDAVREEWEHSIAPVKDTRYSITLRTLK